MVHTKRVYCVGPVASPEELAEKLTRHTWTRCTGFELGGYLFLNDSFSEDGAQDYAVLKKPTTPGSLPCQVESITFGWCDYAQALDYMRRVLAGEYDENGRTVPELSFQAPESHGTCHLCA